jgi:hypothetical protein
MRKKLRNWVINQLTRHLFNTITKEDILVQKNSQLYLKGKLLDKEITGEIKESARGIATSTVWKFLDREVQYQANKMIYEHSVDSDGYIAGKMLLKAREIINNSLTNLSK